MTYNLMHLAALLRRGGGLPNYGNDRTRWSDEQHYGLANPEYRQ